MGSGCLTTRLRQHRDDPSEADGFETHVATILVDLCRALGIAIATSIVMVMAVAMARNRCVARRSPWPWALGAIERSASQTATTAMSGSIVRTKFSMALSVPEMELGQLPQAPW